VISALAALHGAWGVRVHDVRASVDALKVVGAWTRPETRTETAGDDG
jgi:dihydropteroate synthase